MAQNKIDNVTVLKHEKVMASVQAGLKKKGYDCMQVAYMKAKYSSV